MNNNDSVINDLELDLACLIPQLGASSNDMVVKTTKPAMEATSGSEHTKSLQTSGDVEQVASLLEQFEIRSRQLTSNAEQLKPLPQIQRFTKILLGASCAFAIGMNSILIGEGATLHQLAISNIGVLLLFLLACICVLNDLTFRNKSNATDASPALARLACVNRSIEALYTLREQWTREEDGIRQRIEQLQGENQALIDASLEQQSAIARSNAELAGLQSDLELLRQQHARLQEQTIESRSECDERATRIVQLDDAEQSAVSRLELLRTQELEFDEQLSQGRTMLQSLSSELESLHQAIAEQSQLTTDIDRLRRERDGLRDETEFYRCEFERLRTSAEQSQSQLSEIEQQIATKSDEQASLQSVCQRLTESIDEKRGTEAELLRSYEELAGITQSIDAGRQSLQNLDAEQTRIESELEALEQLRATEIDAIAEVRLVQAAILMQTDEVELTKSQHDQLALQAASHRSELEEDLESAIERISQLRSAEAALAIECNLKQREVADAEQRLVRLISDIQSAEADQRALVTSTEALAEREKALTMACAHANARVNEWTQVTEGLEAKVENATEQLRTLDAKHLQTLDAIEQSLVALESSSARHRELEAEIAIETLRLEDLCQRNSEEQQSLANTLVNRKQLQEQVVALELELSNAADSKYRLEVESGAIDQALHGLREEMATSQDLIAELRAQRCACMEDCERINGERNELIAAREIASNDLDSVNQLLQTVRSQLDAATIELTTKQEQSQSLEQSVSQQRTKLDEILLDQNNAADRLVELLSQLHDQELECSRMEERARQIALSSLAHEQQLVAVQNELGNRVESLRAKDEELASHVRSLQELKESIVNAESEIAEIESRRQKLLDELDVLAAEAQRAQTICKDWELYQSKLQRENQSLVTANELAKNSAQSFQEELNRLQTEKTTLSLELEGLKAEKYELQQVVDEQCDRNHELEARRCELESRMGQQGQQLAIQEAKIRAFEQEEQSARLRLEKLGSELGNHQRAVAALAEQKAVLEREISDASRLLDDNAAQVQALLDREQSLAGQIAKSKAELQRLLGEREFIESEKQRWNDGQSDRLAQAAAVESLREQSVTIAETIAQQLRESDELQFHLNELQRSVNSAQKDAQDSLAQGEAMKAQCIAWESKLTSIEQCLADQERAHAASLSESATLEQQIAQLQEAERDCNDRITEAQKRLATLSAQTEATAERLRQLNAKHYEKQLQVVAIEQSIGHKTQQSMELDSLNAALMRKGKETELALQELHAQRENECRLLEANRRERDALLSTRVEIQNELQQLQSQLSKLKIEVDDRNRIVQQLTSDEERLTDRNTQLRSLTLELELERVRLQEVQNRVREIQNQETDAIHQLARMRSETKRLESIHEALTASAAILKQGSEVAISSATTIDSEVDTAVQSPLASEVKNAALSVSNLQEIIDTVHEEYFAEQSLELQISGELRSTLAEIANATRDEPDESQNANAASDFAGFRSDLDSAEFVATRSTHADGGADDLWSDVLR